MGGDEEEEDDDEVGAVGGAGGGASAPKSLADMMPKVDISGQIKADLINELGDKNWKIRGEGLQKVWGWSVIQIQGGAQKVRDVRGLQYREKK